MSGHEVSGGERTRPQEDTPRSTSGVAGPGGGVTRP